MSVCVSTIVFGWYSEFIPVYIYSMLKAYPNFFVRIFLQGNLPESVSRLLKQFPSEMRSNYEVSERYMPSEDFSGQRGKTFRWYLPKSVFKGYEYGYIGDVDFAIVAETPSFLQVHLKHCLKTGLPYSNMVRPGTKRLSGLHFICVDEYFDKISPLIVGNPPNVISSNEEELYNLVMKAFGSVPKDIFRPHHGIHLGLLRGGGLKRLSKENMNRALILKDDPFYKDVLFTGCGSKTRAIYKQIMKLW